MNSFLEKIFSKDEVNTSRQFEFDMAKVVCILGMVFVHIFENMSAPTTVTSSAYYVLVIVLDCIFGAATFMFSMGLGIGYSYKNNPEHYIKRGLKIFILAYVLNFFRDTFFRFLILPFGINTFEFNDVMAYLLILDIMQFAGLALMLFGVLKKLKVSDKWILVIAIIMSIIGSIYRFIVIKNFYVMYSAGLLFGVHSGDVVDTGAPFPLLNWFIIVVYGYLYAQLLKHVKNKKLYYSCTFVISSLVLLIYMIIAIPNRLGMMSDNIMHYYHFSTLDSLILLFGAIFATSLYYFISLFLSDKVKAVITRISSNINRIYCIHWVLLSTIICLQIHFGLKYFNTVECFIVGSIIFIVSILLAEVYTRFLEKRHNN